MKELKEKDLLLIEGCWINKNKIIWRKLKQKKKKKFTIK